MTSIYDGEFGRNILVVGRTGCGKTTFLEKLGINKFFGNLVKTEWISGKDIDQKREAKIQSCFSNETIALVILFSTRLSTTFSTIFSTRFENIKN